MTLLNAFLVRAADAVLTPLAGLPPLVVVGGAAVVSALVVLAVMRVTSNQAALTAVKRRIHAALLEMRLYNDDLGALMRAQGDVLRHNASYVGLSLVPLVITAIPLTLVIAQLQAWYGYDGLVPGTPAVITASLEPGVASPLPTLDAPAFDVAGPPRYFPTLGEVTWPVVPRSTGASTVTVVTASGASATKTVQVATAATARRSPSRERASLVHQLLYPSEPPLDEASGVTAIRVPYPERSVRVLGQSVHWLVAYLVMMVIAVLALRRPLGVVI